MEYKALFIPYKKENGSENATKSDNQKHKQGVNKLVNAKMCRFRDTVPLKHARGIRASPFSTLIIIIIIIIIVVVVVVVVSIQAMSGKEIYGEI